MYWFGIDRRFWWRWAEFCHLPVRFKRTSFLGALVGALIQSVLPLYYRQEDLGNQALRKGRFGNWSMCCFHFVYFWYGSIPGFSPAFTESFGESAFYLTFTSITLIPSVVDPYVVHCTATAPCDGNDFCLRIVGSMWLVSIPHKWMGCFSRLGMVVAYMYEKVVMSVVMRKQGVPMRSIIPVGLFGATVFYWSPR